MSGTVSSATVVATESPKASQSAVWMPIAAETGPQIARPRGVEGEGGEPVVGADPGEGLAGDVALEGRLPDRHAEHQADPGEERAEGDQGDDGGRREEGEGQCQEGLARHDHEQRPGRSDLGRDQAAEERADAHHGEDRPPGRGAAEIPVGDDRPERVLKRPRRMFAIAK